MEDMQRVMEKLNLRLLQQLMGMRQMQKDTQKMQTEPERSREAPQRQGGQPAHSVVDTRVLSKPESYTGDPSRFADWNFKMRAYLGAVDERYQHLIEGRRSRRNRRGARRWTRSRRGSAPSCTTSSC